MILGQPQVREDLMADMDKAIKLLSSSVGIKPPVQGSAPDADIVLEVSVTFCIDFGLFTGAATVAVALAAAASIDTIHAESYLLRIYHREAWWRQSSRLRKARN